MKSTKFYIGNMEYWVFHSFYGYQVLMGRIDKKGSIHVVSPEGGKFYKTKATAIKALRNIVKNST